MSDLKCARLLRSRHFEEEWELCGDPALYLVEGTALCPKHAKLSQQRALPRNEL